MIWTTVGLLILAFVTGLVAGIWLARSEMERLADKLTETRNRLFDCNRRLNESERDLHGRRG